MCKRLVVLLATLTAVSVATSATAQEARPRIVLVVLASGSVPEDITRDVQDLFVTALAENSAYEIADRESVFTNTKLDGDVDLLLCVNQPECLLTMHNQHRYEQYVLVKVEGTSSVVKFSVVTFNFENVDPIEFSDAVSVPANDVGALIDRAFEAADQVQLVPVGTGHVETPPLPDCSKITCDDDATCVEGVCVAQDAPRPELPGEPPAFDWRMIAGYSLVGAGGLSTVLAIVFYVDAADARDTYSASYADNGEILVSDLNQRQGHKNVQDIESGATLYQASAVAASVCLASGAGLLAWYYLLPGPADASSDQGEGAVSLTPLFGLGVAGVSASLTF